MESKGMRERERETHKEALRMRKADQGTRSGRSTKRLAADEEDVEPPPLAESRLPGLGGGAHQPGVSKQRREDGGGAAPPQHTGNAEQQGRETTLASCMEKMLRGAACSSADGIYAARAPWFER